MKVLKTILLGVLGIAVVLLVIAAFTKKDYAIERSIAINKPKAEVFSYVKQLRNQDHFSVWARKDPAMKKEYRGTDGTVGFVSAWDSQDDEVGQGEQEIKGIKEGERVDYELRFIRPFEAKDQAYMSTESVSEGQTKVKWGFAGRMNFPMNLMLLFVNMEDELGGQLQQGLEQLKTNLEK